MISGFVGLVTVLLFAMVLGDLWVRIAGAPADPECRIATSVLAGLLALGFLAQALSLLGIRWSVASLGVAVVVLFAALWRGARRAAKIERDERPRPAVGWAFVAALPVLLFAWSCVALRSPYSDFVYHWGVKAKRFFVVGALDFDFLRAAERAYMHPDYPHLFPDLLAWTAVVGGVFEERVLLLWTAIFLALLVLVARAAMAGMRDPVLAGLAWSSVAVAVGAFCIGHLLGGSPDPGIALAALLGGVLLQRREPLVVAGSLGIVAAFATFLKVEGAVLGVVLVGWVLLQGGRDWRHGKRRLLALLWPLLASWAAWLLPLFVFDLWQPSHRGWPDLARFPDLLAPLVQAAAYGSWQALPWLLLVAPFLLLRRSTRGYGLVALSLLAFDLYVYLATPVDVAFLILASFPRLALHVLPLVLVACFWGLEELAGGASGGAEARGAAP